MDHSDSMKQNHFEKRCVDKRKLGKTEAVFQMMDDVQSNNFAIIVRIKKTLNASEVKNALREEVEINPILSTKIITQKRRYYFQKVPSFSAVNLKEISIAENDLYELIAYHLCLKFSVREAPFYRLLLITTPINQYLVGIYCHSVGDALSGFHSIKRVLFRASGVYHDGAISLNEIKPLSPSLIDAAQTSLWPISKFMAFGTSNTKRFLRHALVGFPKHIPQFKPAPNTEKNELNILATDINGDSYHNLLKICKSKQVTVNTLLVTLLFLSLNRQWQDSQNRNLGITLAVDMRRRLGIDNKSNQFGLYMGPMTFSSKISPNEDFWIIARSVAKDITSGLVCNEHLFFELLPQWIMKESTDMAKTMGPPLKGPLFSNVGKIFTNEDDKKLSVIAEDITFAISPRKQMTFGLSVSSYNNRLNLLLTHEPLSISEEVCRNILNGIERGVKDVVGENLILKELASVEA